MLLVVLRRSFFAKGADLQADGFAGVGVEEVGELGFVETEILLTVGHDAGHGDGAADEVGAIGAAGDEVIADEEVPPGESIATGAEAGGGDGIGDEDGFFEAGGAKVVLEGEEGDVDAVGDEAEPEAVMQGKGALDDVVMTVHLHGAAVADVGEHGEAVTAGGFELLQGGVAVASGDGDAVVGEKLGDVVALVALGGEGDEAGEALPGIEEELGVLQVGGFDGGGGMGADVAFFTVDEGAFEVEADDHTLGEFVFFAQLDQGADAALHGGDVVGDEGGEDGFAAVFLEANAGVVEGLGGEAVLVEVGASVAIDLEIERFHGKKEGKSG